MEDERGTYNRRISATKREIETLASKSGLTKRQSCSLRERTPRVSRHARINIGRARND